ncbi:MAG TPA: purine-nucleoside phosphorylase [bacterium]|jgi:purine-nucleoside phosphorylase|nr:purine-nucleoside phosphorylase [bacterium]
MDLKSKIAEAVAAIAHKTTFKPKVGIILGTGLGALAREIKADCVVDYEDIPHMPASTVESHHGKMHFGRLGSKDVVAFQGRFHLYEGYTAQQVSFPVRLMKALGCTHMLVSNAAGGMNRAYEPGDLVVIDDHINLQGCNPLIGVNDDSLGPRWPDMSEPYDRKLASEAMRLAMRLGIRAHRGVYVAVSGPNLETAAEYRWLSGMADVVGMSTVPEVIAAVHAGIKVLGISVVTDECVADRLKAADIREIIRIAGEAEPKLTRLMAALIEGMEV